MILKNRFSFSRLIDDTYRYRVQLFIIPMIFGLISFGMFLLNVVTHKRTLMYETLIFSILSIFCAFISLFIKKKLTISYLLFSTSCIALFVCFLINGGTEGFSPIWVLALPTCGMLFMGRKKGTLLCAIMFVIILFFLWTPFGNGLLQYEYTKSFTMRFPLVYISFYLIGLFFESVRYATNTELILMQKKYQELSTKDALTTIYNRYWFNELLKTSLSNLDHKPICLLLIDIDHFKKFNDENGHIFGDQVLKTIAVLLEEKTKSVGSVCRWGGEEFAVLLENCNEAAMLMHSEVLREAVQNIDLLDQNKNPIKITVSIGAVYLQQSNKMELENIIELADKALYKAKECGRNCIRIVTK